MFDSQDLFFHFHSPWDNFQSSYDIHYYLHNDTVYHIFSPNQRDEHPEKKRQF